MRWEDQGSSDNIEDRRGSVFGGRGFGGGFPIRLGGGGGFSITTLIVIFVIMWMLGFDPMKLLNGDFSELGGGGPSYENRMPSGPNTAQNDTQAKFVSAVLATTERTWDDLFKQMGSDYEKPKLVLFSGGISSACGLAQSASGPFYCPNDRKVYLDMSFFQELEQRFGAPGDFARAYVIGHEIGHHVQNQLGVIERVQEMKRKTGAKQGNALQVRVELQADCLAGVWAKRADEIKPLLEPGDAEEALAAASAIGDDRLQKKMQGHVVPESFTHGTSEQRMQWFKTGLSSGKIDSCDTFSDKN
ncbi:MAG: neutral zinc metallopeptidase [Pseudomonadota bacterium]